VSSEDAAGVPVLMRGEFLHVFMIAERVQSHLPVRVQHGSSEMQAAGLEYDHATRKLDLKGPLRAVLAARATVPRP
jgi:lipopolysaccharide export system protein LptC